MAAKIEGEDGEALFLQFLGQAIPAPLGAIAAEFVQQDDAGGLVAVAAGIEGPLEYDAVGRVELDLLPIGADEMRGKNDRERRRQSQEKLAWGRDLHVTSLQDDRAPSLSEC